MEQEAKEELMKIDNLELYFKPTWNLKQLAKALGMSVNTVKKQEWFNEIPYIPNGEHKMWLQEDVIKTLKEYRILNGGVYRDESKA